MAYSVANPPQLLIAGMNGGRAVWSYDHTDVHTDVDAADYFTDGHALGMRVGDVVFVGKSDATVGVTVHRVSVSTAGGAATVAPAILA